MQKEIITNKQGIFIMSTFIFGSSIITGAGREAKQDVWLAIIIGLIMSFPMVFIYSSLLKLYPGKDLYDILKEVFGNVLGKIISLFYIWYSFHLGALVIANFSGFVNVTSFPETPQTIITVFVGLFCIWVVKAGIEVLGRWSAFAFPISVTIIVITIILSMTNINFINLKPIMYDGIKPVLTSSFGFFSFPLAETVVFVMVFNTLKNRDKTFKVFLSSVCISSTIIMAIAVRNILVLGASVTSSLYFPSYLAVRTLNIGDFFQRFEIVVALTFIFGGFVKVSVCLYAATLGVAKVLNIEDYRYLVAPVGFLMMNLACTIYQSMMEMFDWATKTYPYYAIPFQIILPIIILVVAKIKIKLKSKKHKAIPVANE
ncbi:MAG: GerAB/ArcD/ProY family transporter [Ruminiclostridium sp.]